MFSHLNLDILSSQSITELTGEDLRIAVNKARGFAVVEFVRGSQNLTVWALLDPQGNELFVADTEAQCWDGSPSYNHQAAWWALLDSLVEEGLLPYIVPSTEGWSIEVKRELPNDSNLENLCYTYLCQTPGLGDIACIAFLLAHKKLREENPWALIKKSETE